MAVGTDSLGAGELNAAGFNPIPQLVLLEDLGVGP